MNARRFTLPSRYNRRHPRLRVLIDQSVRGLQQGDYTPAQIEGALHGTLGVDSQLLADGTWFVGEQKDAPEDSPLIAVGGWSRRKTLCGGDSITDRDGGFLDPAQDYAKIRAFYVHPEGKEGNWNPAA